MSIANVWELLVYDKNKLVYKRRIDGPIELGRQVNGEEVLFSERAEAGVKRVIIAELDEIIVSRKHALLEPLDAGGIGIQNLSTRVPIRFSGGGGELPPSGARELVNTAVLILGGRMVRIQKAESESMLLRNLEEPTVPPGMMDASSNVFKTLPFLQASGEGERLIRWLQTTMGVLQSAASSSDFLSRAAQGIVQMVGLDSGRVLQLREGQWDGAALHTAAGYFPGPQWQPSRRVLDHLLGRKQTFWQMPDPSAQTGASLLGIDAVVAAPILDRHGEVVGALYGERLHRGGTSAGLQITKAEAMLVELLASGVAAGLARLEQEQAAIAERVRFEQFFTPELARRLASDPDLLRGQDAEITLLFCDIRGFSRISERLGPTGTVDWIGDVMGTLSECVLRHQGVLIDYIGDELMAMWGAPEPQPDHARLACQAALEMLEQLPSLTDRWQPILGEAMDVGIGVNSGVARVGNTGTQRKFKYGPLGNTVNLASRVQGATKYLKVRVLATGATLGSLEPAFSARRLCTVRVVNISEPVDLYELTPAGKPNWPELKQAYERALEEFEHRDYPAATRTLGKLLAEYPNDGPSLVLLSRTVTGFLEGAAPGHPVWELPGK